MMASLKDIRNNHTNRILLDGRT